MMRVSVSMSPSLWEGLGEGWYRALAGVVANPPPCLPQRGREKLVAGPEKRA